MRRTTNIDVAFPPAGATATTIVVAGRDMSTDDDGRTHVLDTTELRLQVELADGRITQVTQPSSDRASDDRASDKRASGERASDDGAYDGLIGLTLRRGFSRALAQRFGDGRSTLTDAVLEDLTGAFLVAGYSTVRTGRLAPDPAKGPERAALQADVCIGWKTGGPMHTVALERGQLAIPYGPHVGDLAAEDPLGWHPMDPMSEHMVRRRRQIDVEPRDGGVAVQAHMRDSYAVAQPPRSAEPEMVMHEYLLHARFDRTARLAELDADALVLPWKECPGALHSARRLIGASVEDLAPLVRSELAGPVGCTHLSSTLRSLASAVAPAF